MIICVCRAVCDRTLQALVDQGADTVEKVERACGAGGDCGTCRPEVERLIQVGTACADRSDRANRAA